MLTLSSLKSHFNYFLEGIFANRVTIKIDQFDLNTDETNILVIYRLGRQKLAQRLVIADFSTKYFEHLSGYDRQRITKFTTLQDLLANLFSDECATRHNLINYIKTVLKHDQLF